ncbi:hypothetical protein E4U41_002586 [Claviceps citrina]|nr:hypothetical protein E4U41_002586 [Claviceps citrina]
MGKQISNWTFDKDAGTDCSLLEPRNQVGMPGDAPPSLRSPRYTDLVPSQNVRWLTRYGHSLPVRYSDSPARAGFSSRVVAETFFSYLDFQRDDRYSQLQFGPVNRGFGSDQRSPRAKTRLGGARETFLVNDLNTLILPTTPTLGVTSSTSPTKRFSRARGRQR